MDYKKHYNLLIMKAKLKLITGDPVYLEQHHIIPKCIGGTDDPKNLVYLLPEEHYIAHLLLVKIYPNESKLAHAANMMVAGSKNNKRNNKSYVWVRKKHACAISLNQSGVGNSQYGTRWITDGVQNKKIKKEDEIPNGWIRGRSNIWSKEQRLQIAERNRKAQIGTTRSQEVKDKISKSLKNRKRGRAVDYLSLEN
jgi:5-methylcytosine-specific restriction endonuclease McrA